MSTASIDLEITGVYPADDHSPEKLLGRVSFSYVPSGLTPTTVTRSYRANDKRKTIDVCIVHGAAVIQVKGATIWNGDDGPYLSCDVSLPRELRERIVTLAMERLPRHELSGAEAGAARPGPR